MNLYPRADQITSEAHYHSADSACLKRVPEIPTGKFVDGQAVMAPADHWWRCTYLAKLEKDSPWRGVYHVHAHGAALPAHEFRDRCGFPA